MPPTTTTTPRQNRISRKPVGTPHRRAIDGSTNTVIHTNCVSASPDATSTSKIVHELDQTATPFNKEDKPFLDHILSDTASTSQQERKATATSYRSVSMNQAQIRQSSDLSLNATNPGRRIISLNGLPPVPFKAPITALAPLSCQSRDVFYPVWPPPEIQQTQPDKIHPSINMSTITTTGCAPQPFLAQSDGTSDITSDAPAKAPTPEYKLNQVTLRSTSTSKESPKHTQHQEPPTPRVDTMSTTQAEDPSPEYRLNQVTLRSTSVLEELSEEIQHQASPAPPADTTSAAQATASAPLQYKTNQIILRHKCLLKESLRAMQNHQSPTPRANIVSAALAKAPVPYYRLNHVTSRNKSHLKEPPRLGEYQESQTPQADIFSVTPAGAPAPQHKLNYVTLRNNSPLGEPTREMRNQQSQTLRANIAISSDQRLDIMSLMQAKAPIPHYKLNQVTLKNTSPLREPAREMQTQQSPTPRAGIATSSDHQLTAIKERSARLCRGVSAGGEKIEMKNILTSTYTSHRTPQREEAARKAARIAAKRLADHLIVKITMKMAGKAAKMEQPTAEKNGGSSAYGKGGDRLLIQHPEPKAKAKAAEKRTELAGAGVATAAGGAAVAGGAGPVNVAMPPTPVITPLLILAAGLFMMGVVCVVIAVLESGPGALGCR
ncbi:hypothetical protein BDZ45DRAFT_139211 [Acephala macrosclerotiorum]|nr:hypothetical protein BDZ45DRAFT_139211 [Acephala macrosclerotiorum]